MPEENELKKCLLDLSADSTMQPYFQAIMLKLADLEHDLKTPSTKKKVGFIFGKARIKTAAGWGKYKEHYGTLIYETEQIETRGNQVLIVFLNCTKMIIQKNSFLIIYSKIPPRKRDERGVEIEGYEKLREKLNELSPYDSSKKAPRAVYIDFFPVS